MANWPTCRTGDTTRLFLNGIRASKKAFTLHPMRAVFVVALLLLLLCAASNATFTAGVAKLNGTLPIGTPLAGYNWGPRRISDWPLPKFGRPYTTWMEPSQGIITPTWVKALVISDGNTYLGFLTIDAIGMDGTLAALAYDIAAGMGLPIPRGNLIFSGSHSHSGPGAITPEFLWAFAPAADLMVPSLQRQLATTMAEALIEAWKSMQPATFAIGQTDLLNVTTNRRASYSPYVTKGTIDPHLGVIRIDTAEGEPLATLWNFAIHGTCLGPENMYFCGDIMGAASDAIEATVGGVALFVNGDAGDIDPAGWVCEAPNGPPAFAGAPTIADAVAALRGSLSPVSSGVTLAAASATVSFGPANLNITLQRIDNCTVGGPLDICSICKVLDCTLQPLLDASWIENTPLFVAFTFEVAGELTVMVSMPGEALVELGWQIYNDTLIELGFNRTLLAGYSNNHMGYFATPNEYLVGGYESELTFWGINTAEMVRAGVKQVASVLAPGGKKITSSIIAHKPKGAIVVA